MFAVVESGGKQYKVSQGSLLRLEQLHASEGANITLDQVLMLHSDAGTIIGKPVVEGASVEVEVLENMRTDKVIIFKKKRRTTYKRTKSHRQEMVYCRVKEIKTK